MTAMTTLSNNVIRRLAPSIFTETAAARTSSRYTMIPTIDMVEGLRGEGWFPVEAAEAKTRLDDNRGFQKHIVKFQHRDLVMGEEAVQLLLTNSHNGLSSYSMDLGVIRFVCMNGLVVGDFFKRICIRHSNKQLDDVVEASYEIVKSAPELVENITHMKALPMTDQESLIFANAALQIAYDKPEEAPIEAEQLLGARRNDDRQGHLWSSLNRVQENVIRGGLKGRNRKTGRKVTTRPVKALDRSSNLNKALFTLAQEMAKLKEA